MGDWGPEAGAANFLCPVGETAGNIDLMEDLWRSWQALWGGGGETELLEFTAHFGTVRQALRTAVRCREAGLAAPEKLALGRLLQGMERLAGGRIGAEDVQWCREAGNRVSRMVAAWKSDDLRPEEKSQSQQAHGAQDDISSSIDEWFSQVSHFIPQSPEDDLDTAVTENDFGDNLQKPDKMNPEGYLEDNDFKKLNRAIKEGGEGAYHMLERDIEAFAKKCVGMRGLKDPAVCYSLQYWIKLLPNPYIIHLERDIMDVKGSFSKYKAYAQDYNQVIDDWWEAKERNLKNLPAYRMRLQYEDLVENPEREIRRIAEFIGVEYKEECTKLVRQ